MLKSYLGTRSIKTVMFHNNNLFKLSERRFSSVVPQVKEKSRFKLIFQYRGTSFVGYQKQNNKGEPCGNTVQMHIEKALHKLFNTEDIYIVGSSRTDAGVHALHNTCHFDVDSSIIEKRKNYGEKNILFGLNYYLEGQDIVVCACEKKDFDFHARHRVKEREYQYRILLVGPRPDISYKIPFIANQYWLLNAVPFLEGAQGATLLPPQSAETSFRLDEMREASQLFIGTHDFSNFCKTHIPKHVTRVKNISAIDIEEIDIRQNETSSPLFFSVAKCKEIRLTIRGNSFLHNQVRIMVDALVKVATGKLTGFQIRRALDCPQVPFHYKGAAPPDGLYLTNIVYHEDGYVPTHFNDDDDDGCVQ